MHTGHTGFNVEDATKYGVDEAIILDYIKRCVWHEEATHGGDDNGEVWFYNSDKAFTSFFRFWNIRIIRDILNSLEIQEVIKIKSDDEGNKFYSLKGNLCIKSI